MPGLPHHGHELSGFVDVPHASPITRAPPATKPSPSIMATAVEYNPPQMDALASTTTQASRQNPLRLLLHDAGVLSTTLRYLPWIVLPFHTADDSCELYMGVSGARDVVLQSWLFILETTFLLFTIPAVLILPGALLLGLATFCGLVVYAVSWPMRGPRIAYSKMDDETIKSAEQHDTERWLFVNGCMTGHSGLQKNIDRLSKTFGRAVIGIHNNSYGLVVDLIECLIQRCFSYKTMDVRVTYDYVKACLADPTVTKVVLVGHSQGGIIISLVLDELFADLPRSTMSKLEIYTFGSAASHFSNPLVSLASHPRCIRHIEHYCNEYDMIPRWGVIHGTTSVLDNRYNGSVFVRMGATGHMFNQHYMDAMFPLETPSHQQQMMQQQQQAPISDPKTLVAKAISFLDKRVDIDVATVVKREKVAAKRLGFMRMESGFLESPPTDTDSGSGERNRSSESTVNFVREGANKTMIMSEVRGKTVRELSRLWRYEGGGIPVEINGV